MTVQVGDVVCLKSGGPNMTVLGIAKDMGQGWAGVPGDDIVVVWIDSLGHKMIEAFHPDTLMFANTDPKI